MDEMNTPLDDEQEILAYFDKELDDEDFDIESYVDIIDNSREFQDLQIATEEFLSDISFGLEATRGEQLKALTEDSIRLAGDLTVAGYKGGKKAIKGAKEGYRLGKIGANKVLAFQAAALLATERTISFLNAHRKAMDVLDLSEIVGDATKLITVTAVDNVNDISDKVVNVIRKIVGADKDDFTKEDAAKVIKLLASKKNTLQIVAELNSPRHRGLALNIFANEKAIPTYLTVFTELNTKFTDDIYKRIHVYTEEIAKIIESENYHALATFDKHILSNELKATIHKLAQASNVSVNSSDSTLKLSKKIIAGTSNQFKVSKLDANERLRALSTLKKQADNLDKAKHNLIEASNKLAKFNKADAESLTKIKSGLSNMHWQKSGKQVMNDMKTGTNAMQAHNQQRIFKEIDTLWGVVNMVSKISITFLMGYEQLAKKIKLANKDIEYLAKLINKHQE